MDELPPHAKAVLRRAQEYDQCRDDEARRRVREGVARALGGGPVNLSASSATRSAARPAATVTKTSPLLGLSKLTVAAALITLVGSGIALRRRGEAPLEPHQTRAAATDSQPPAVVPPPASGQSLALGTNPVLPASGSHHERSRDPQPAAQRAARRARATFAASGAPAATTLDAEVRLLRLLEDAIERRDTRTADRLLTQHRARFQQPVLREERQGFSVLVRCMEHGGGALSAARAFVTRYPNSVLTARVLRECSSEAR